MMTTNQQIRQSFSTPKFIVDRYYHYRWYSHVVCSNCGRFFVPVCLLTISMYTVAFNKFSYYMCTCTCRNNFYQKWFLLNFSFNNLSPSPFWNLNQEALAEQYHCKYMYIQALVYHAQFYISVDLVLLEYLAGQSLPCKF